MCGIAGAIGAIDARTLAALERMSAAQAHRGPDASGSWISSYGTRRDRVAFAHRRLAIIDLSEDGRQPMIDPDTGNVIVFNGEIYNFEVLRDDLRRAGASFRSRSDTEVILKAYARWGQECLAHLRGMFAFAIWDAERRVVLIARDRLGIKPLYLHRAVSDAGVTVLFASELRALLASGLVPRTADPVGLATYLWNGFVVGPNTIVRGVELLPAGTFATVSADGPAPLSPRRYWLAGTGPVAPRTTRDLAEHLEEAVRSHLVSDVPLGIFLSGGIDSSAVAALAVRAGAPAVRTFTIGFDEATYDESSHALAVARALGTDHEELRLTKDAFACGLGGALRSLDQPTFDGINTYFVSRSVREAGLTVALAGTGGDELFGGYRTFSDVPWAAAWSRRLSFVPAGVKARGATAALRALGRGGDVPPQTRWGKLSDVLAAGGDLLATYQIASGLFSSDFASQLARAPLARTDHGLPPDVASSLRARDAGGRLGHLSTIEQECFLRERLLRDTDAASMASSLEVRVPLLDHEVVEAVAGLTTEARFAPLGRKQILRDVALGDLDARLFDRQKRGFVLPIDRWARDVLKGTMTDAFADRSFSERAGLEPRAVGRLWRAFLERRPGQYWSRVWAVYVLGWWCETYGVTA